MENIDSRVITYATSVEEHQQCYTPNLQALVVSDKSCLLIFILRLCHLSMNQIKIIYAILKQVYPRISPAKFSESQFNSLEGDAIKDVQLQFMTCQSQ